MTSKGCIFLSAGEASGDHYGAEILAALHAQRPGLEYFGLGGLAMERNGLRRVVRAEDVAVMGITEIVRHIPVIVRSYRRLKQAICAERPLAAVLIDFPDVNFRLAKYLKRLGIPVVWFVSPQLWAWKRRRLRWVQQRVDRMMVIFPFEERFYRARGVKAEFVGHPLALQFAEKRSRLVSATERAKIALLPGSRWREIAANLPEMVRLAGLLYDRYDFELPVASTIRRDELAALLEKLLPVSTGRPTIRLVDDAFGALERARASIVASGTATVLAAIAGNPFIVVYRVSETTFALARRLVRYPVEIGAKADQGGILPVAMVNLIAGRRVVPELINARFSAEELLRTLEPLLADGATRERQKADLTAVTEALLPADRNAKVGCERVAEAVLQLINPEDVRSAQRRV